MARALQIPGSSGCCTVWPLDGAVHLLAEQGPKAVSSACKLDTGGRHTSHRAPAPTGWGPCPPRCVPPQTSSSHPLPGGACVGLGLTAGISAWSPAGRPGSVSLDCDVVWARTQELPLTESRSLPGSLQV